MRLAASGLICPPALRPGARLAIVSPASAVREDLVRAGMAALERMGYRPMLMPHALGRGPLYFAGTVGQRVADLHDAFADPVIDGIVAARGGWGTAELLPHLDRALIRANPKVYAGYSDHTSLHQWLAREAGLLSFHAPMVASDFARENGCDETSWRHALETAAPCSLGREHGLRTLRAGVVEGTLTGGCIAIVAESLGTPYAPAADASPHILFLEDVGVKPYQWDRMLLHLRYAGILARAGGIVFGDMRQCVAAHEMELLEGALLHALQDFPGPIAIGLRSGHVDTPNITVPLGLRARLALDDPENPRLDFLESAVTV